MKYLVIEIQKFDTGAMATPSYAFDNINSALAKYYDILSKAAKSTLYIHSAVLLNETGAYLRSEYFDHTPAPEPEPTPESVPQAE